MSKITTKPTICGVCGRTPAAHLPNELSLHSKIWEALSKSRDAQVAAHDAIESLESICTMLSVTDG